MNLFRLTYCLVALLCFLFARETDAQPRMTEYISRVCVNNVTQVKRNEIEFDLHLNRVSNAWERWANGTFQLRLVGVPESDYVDSKMSIILVSGTSDLQQQAYQNDVLTRYVIDPRVIQGRLSISVLGPDEFADSKFVPQSDSIRIGRFRVHMNDTTRLRDTLTWATPIEYYQANAFKVEVDTMYNSTKLYSANDNVEMRDLPCVDASGLSTVRRDTFVVAARPPKCMQVDSFIAQYLGERQVGLQWVSHCEQGVQGYILRRRVKSGLCFDSTEREFHEIRRFGDPFDPEMFSKGRTTNGFSYKLHVPDTVVYRDMVYEYELSGLYFDGEQRYLDTTDIYIPNSIILKAAIFPNPVTDSATIRYMVEDNVLITAKVYDITGKELQTLMEKKLHTRRVSPKRWYDVKEDDSYTVGWSRPDQAGQGVYFVIFTAYPVDDNSIELSRAVVKIMVLR